MKKSARILWLAVLLPLSALAVEGPFESPIEEDEDVGIAMPICRESSAANGDPVYCDDGTVCYSAPGVRHGTLKECGNDSPRQQTDEQKN